MIKNKKRILLVSVMVLISLFFLISICNVKTAKADTVDYGEQMTETEEISPRLLTTLNLGIGGKDGEVFAKVTNEFKRDRKKVETKYMNNQIEKIKNLSYASDIEFVDNNIFLKSVFDKLSRYEQKLLILYYWCDYTLNEIGTILKKPKSTIASQLNRIKAKISEDK